MVSVQPSPADRGAVSRDHGETTWALPVLRNHRKLGGARTFPPRDALRVAFLAEPSFTACSDELGALQRLASAVSGATGQVRSLSVRQVANHGPRSRMRESRKSGSVRGGGE